MDELRAHASKTDTPPPKKNNRKTKKREKEKEAKAKAAEEQHSPKPIKPFLARPALDGILAFEMIESCDVWRYICEFL